MADDIGAVLNRRDFPCSECGGQVPMDQHEGSNYQCPECKSWYHWRSVLEWLTQGKHLV